LKETVSRGVSGKKEGLKNEGDGRSIPFGKQTQKGITGAGKRKFQEGGGRTCQAKPSTISAPIEGLDARKERVQK